MNYIKSVEIPKLSARLKILRTAEYCNVCLAAGYIARNIEVLDRVPNQGVCHFPLWHLHHGNRGLLYIFVKHKCDASRLSVENMRDLPTLKQTRHTMASISCWQPSAAGVEPLHKSCQASLLLILLLQETDQSADKRLV